MRAVSSHVIQAAELIQNRAAPEGPRSLQSVFARSIRSRELETKFHQT